jgi:hypothetical protein
MFRISAKQHQSKYGIIKYALIILTRLNLKIRLIIKAIKTINTTKAKSMLWNTKKVILQVVLKTK